jgi:hypothetical protein
MLEGYQWISDHQAGGMTMAPGKGRATAASNRRSLPVVADF